MSIQEKSRILMVHKYQQVKNRQQTLLMRSTQELGIYRELSYDWNLISGKIDPTTRMIYSRSSVAMS